LISIDICFAYICHIYARTNTITHRYNMQFVYYTNNAALNDNVLLIIH